MENLINFLSKVPSIDGKINGNLENGFWWLKFAIQIDNTLAWNVIQELSHVINYLSLDEKLPTVFYPVSPPPYLNGGPKLFLSWVIENKEQDFTPDDLKSWLEARLPDPIDDEKQWIME